MQICLGGIRLRDRLSRLRIGVTDLGQVGLPLLVAFGGRNKHYALLWLVEGEVRERDLVRSMSHTVDPTQYQQDYEVYEQVKDQAYHFEEPQPHQYQFDAYQQHHYEDHHEQPHIEQDQPHIEQ